MFGVLHALGLAAYRIGVHLAALVRHPKARKAVTGRRGWEDRLARAARSASPDRQGEWIHLHCASFGEFEQGAPVLAALRERAPERPILLTFFSPSGIESVPPDVADHVDYLPLDSPRPALAALIPRRTRSSSNMNCGQVSCPLDGGRMPSSYGRSAV